jgi:hypothetical protein
MALDVVPVGIARGYPLAPGTVPRPRDRNTTERSYIIVDSTHIAWAAGLFDGEGCITLYRRTKCISRTCSLVLSMTDEDLVYRFKEVVKVGTVSFRKAKNPAYKDQWAWNTQKRQDIITVLKLLHPWFGSRRAQKASEAIELCEQNLLKRKPSIPCRVI